LTENTIIYYKIQTTTSLVTLPTESVGYYFYARQNQTVEPLISHI